MKRVIPSLALGWIGTFTGWFTAAHPYLSTLATLTAIAASGSAFLASWRTARLRQLEIEKAKKLLAGREDESKSDPT